MVLENDNVVAFHFEKVEQKLEHLNTWMVHMYNMIKKEHPPQAEERIFFEGGPGGGCGSGGGSSSGSGTRKGKEDPNSHKYKSVEDSLTKGEKKGEAATEKYKGKGEDKGKGKQVMSYEDFYYQGEKDDFDAFNIEEEQEELLGVNKFEQEASFDKWEVGDVPSDSQCNEEFKKQQLNLRRKEDEL